MSDKERILDIATRLLPSFATDGEHTGSQAIEVSLALAALLVQKWKAEYPAS